MTSPSGVVIAGNAAFDRLIPRLHYSDHGLGNLWLLFNQVLFLGLIVSEMIKFILPGIDLLRDQLVIVINDRSPICVTKSHHFFPSGKVLFEQRDKAAAV